MASTILVSVSSVKREELPARATTTTETPPVTAATLLTTQTTAVATMATTATTTLSSLTTLTTNNAHHAVPAQIVTAPPEAANRRGHMRSASLENGAKNSPGLPIVGQMDQGNQIILTGTLKSRNEQKRLRNKFGSHSNLEDYLQLTRNTANSNNGLCSAINAGGDGISNKFQNIRQMFEISRNRQEQLLTSWQKQHRQQRQLLHKQQPADDDLVQEMQNQRQRQQQHQQHSDGGDCIQERRNQQQQQQQYHQQRQQQALLTPQGQTVCQQHQHQHRELFQHHHQQQQQMQQPNITPVSATPTITKDCCGCRDSIAIVSERLNINENCTTGNNNDNSNNNNNKNCNNSKCNEDNNSHNKNSNNNTNSSCSLQNFHQVGQQLQQKQQQQQRQQLDHHQQQQQHQQQLEQSQQHQRSASDLQQFVKGENSDRLSFKSFPGCLENQTQHPDNVQATNPQRPIAYAFKPIPFEPDYSIPMRYCHVATLGDRYGSTPSLAPIQGSNFRFSSTNDLRLSSSCGVAGGVGGGGGGDGVSGGGSIGIADSTSGSSYCNSLLARRRGSRSVKINDSLESIRHTPDSDSTGQSSLNKLHCNYTMNMNSNSNCKSSSSSNNNNNNNQNNRNGINNNNCSKNSNTCNHIVNTNDSTSSASNNNNNNSNNNNHYKYILNDQCDMTPSPSDSGISELDATQKDRDSELSTTIPTRHLMDVHDKVVIQQDKETFWANDDVKRLRYFYEGQQREYCLKLKKMEQMLAMQQFQFKQNKIRLTDSNCKIKEQLAELKNENEALRSNNISLRTSERNYKDRAAYLEVQLQGAQEMLSNLKMQLEENEWKVCERNGEIALLKTQLKEANTEITMKERALVNFKHENTNYEDEESRIYETLQDNKIVTAYKDADYNLKLHNNRDIEMELKQLNKIVILKDQVILALTNELAKLRKELSDLAISQEYGEEPSGKFTRLKNQLDNLTEICSRARPHVVQEEYLPKNIQGKAVDDINLEVIMNCLKTAPILKANCTSPLSSISSFDCNVNPDENTDLRTHSQASTDQRLVKMSTAIQNFVYGSQNLPDIAVSIKTASTNNPSTTTTTSATRSVASTSNTIALIDSHKSPLEETTLDSLIAESSNYAEQIIQLRNQLDHVREGFEKEKLQWCEEREKVLSYQKQLQTHYINMYQKLRSLQKTEHEHEV